jgi:hypothetical protein
VQEVVLDPSKSKPFVAMEKELAEARQGTTKAEQERRQEELEEKLKAVQGQYVDLVKRVIFVIFVIFADIQNIKTAMATLTRYVV